MRTRWLLNAFATAAMLAAPGGIALAQGHGHGRGNGGMPPGQAKKAERAEQARFDDHDREIARNWYIHEERVYGHRGGNEDQGEDEARGLPPGLRGRDRLPPGIERKLQPGWVVDEDERPDIYPAPVALVRVFPPPPPGCSYVLFGGHLVLLGAGYRVFDVIHLELNLGM